MRPETYLVVGIVSALLLASLVSLALAEIRETTITTSATVLPYIGVDWSYSAVDFGSITPPLYDVKPVNLNQDLGQFNTTVTTNANYSISAYISALPSGLTHYFNANSTIADATNKAYAKTLTGTYQVINSFTITAGGTFTDYHAHWLDVASGVLAGAKSWTLYERYYTI